MSKCKGCGNDIVTSGPRPYYELVSDSTVEDHTTHVHENVYAVGVLSCTSWNVPDLNQDVAITLEGVALIPVGAYLYHPAYGYYLITHWNPESGQIGILNEGLLNNATPGTFVPKHTPFLVQAKPCCEEDNSSIFPFLEDNFIAPAVNVPETINVTSSFGLTTGDYVRIGSGVYLLQAINSTRELVILNQGAGQTPGEEIEARDENGELQYLLTSEGAYVCNTDVLVPEGRLIVCDAGDQRVITGQAVNHILRLLDPVTGLVEFAALSAASIEEGTITAQQIADGTITAQEIADGTITAQKIASNAITTVKIADANITAAKLADNSVTSGKIVNGAVVADKLATDSVSTTKIVDRAVTGVKIGIGAVDTGEIALGAVNVDRILDGNVTNPKIADGAVNSLKLAVNSVLANHIASFAAIGGVYTPSMTMEVPVTGLTANGVYYIVGSLILTHVSVSGTPSADFSTILLGLPTTTASDGSPGSSEWPAIMSLMPVGVSDVEVAQIRRAATYWAAGSTNSGDIEVWFAPSIPNGSFVRFSVWGIYPYK